MTEISRLGPSELLAQLKAFDVGAEIDKETRKQIHEASRQLALNTEDNATAIFRNTLGTTIQLAVQRIALDAGIFIALAQNGSSKSLTELAALTRMDAVLLSRIMRALAAFGVVQEHQDQSYSLRPSCKALGDPDFNDAAAKVGELVGPLVGEILLVLHENGWTNPRDRFNGAAQRAFNAPGKELFDILMDMGPETAKAFSVFLSIGGHDSDKVHEAYSIEERLIQGFANETVFWVDVGGGFGQHTLDLMRAHPCLQGKCVVQDQPMVVAQARLKGLDKAVEFREHDFFKEQPIKGARTYYFRQCFHNWQDENCQVMLRRTAEAMKSDYSRLLIHELIMPEYCATPWQVMMDILMMAGYSTHERSEKQWHELVDAVGLKINKIYSRPGAAESVIEIIKG